MRCMELTVDMISVSKIRRKATPMLLSLACALGPGMALAFCNAVGISPEEAAMVGDAVHDLAMGRAAGFDLNIGVLSGTSGREDLEDFADLVLDSVNDLPGRPESGLAGPLPPRFLPGGAGWLYPAAKRLPAGYRPRPGLKDGYP